MNAFPKFPWIGNLKIDVSTRNAFPKFPWVHNLKIAILLKLLIIN
jgi:hypothetical protein